MEKEYLKLKHVYLELKERKPPTNIRKDKSNLYKSTMIKSGIETEIVKQGRRRSNAFISEFNPEIPEKKYKKIIDDILKKERKIISEEEDKKRLQDIIQARKERGRSKKEWINFEQYNSETVLEPMIFDMDI